MILYFNFNVGSAIEYAGDIFKDWIRETGITFYEVKDQDADCIQIETISKVKPKLIIVNEIFDKSYVSSLFYKKIFPDTKILCIAHLWNMVESNLKNTKNFHLHVFLKLCDSIITLNHKNRKWNHGTEKLIYDFYYPTNPDTFKIKVDWKDRQKNFLYFGNILPHKLSKEFIEKIEGTNIFIDCYGKKFEEEDLLEYNELFSNCKNLIYKGLVPQEDIPNILNEYKYFVLPHDGYEPFNWAILQSAFCGTIPLIVNDTTTNRFDPTWLDWSEGLCFVCDKVDDIIGNLNEIITLNPDFSELSKHINMLSNKEFNYERFKSFFIRIVKGIYYEQRTKENI